MPIKKCLIIIKKIITILLIMKLENNKMNQEVVQEVQVQEEEGIFLLGLIA